MPSLSPRTLASRSAIDHMVTTLLREQPQFDIDEYGKKKPPRERAEERVAIEELERHRQDFAQAILATDPTIADVYTRCDEAVHHEREGKTLDFFGIFRADKQRQQKLDRIQDIWRCNFSTASGLLEDARERFVRGRRGRRLASKHMEHIRRARKTAALLLDDIPLVFDRVLETVPMLEHMYTKIEDTDDDTVDDFLTERYETRDTFEEGYRRYAASRVNFYATRNRIAAANILMIKPIVTKYSSLGVLDEEEVVGLCYEGLLRGVERFRSEYGVVLGTHLPRWIRNPVQLRLRTLSKEYRRNTHAFGRRLDMEFLQDALEDDDVELESVHMQRRQEAKNAAYRAIDTLDDPRMRTIIRERFGLNAEQEVRSLKDIGSTLGLTKERVRQLETQALNQLEALSPKILGDSLYLQ